MSRRILDVTASTTLDHVDARIEGEGWTEETPGVIDVTSPEGEAAVTLSLELDPVGVERLPHHADAVSLTPAQARSLAEELSAVASAAERGETVTSGRGSP